MKDAAAKLDAFFTARSIAVIGASVHKQKVGYQILSNLVLADRASSAGKRKQFYPINPTASEILGLACTPTISQVADPIDVVIIVTPGGTVLALIEEIIERNRLHPEKDRVKAVIIISAGFAEIDQEGRELQKLIATRLALAKISLLGPNTLGLIHNGHHLNASFAQSHIPTGNLAVISQSGAMLTSLFHSLASRQAGVSFAVSLGNKADINENDCLEYALHDSHTSAVIMYIESFSHFPQFFELVSQVRKTKPVILLKGGVSERGQAASLSHTAALASNQALLQAASNQFGFTLVENMESLMNVAFFFAHHKHLPTNTVVITNAGGPAVNTIDALDAASVPLAKWSKTGQENIKDLLPRSVAANPLDLLGDAGPEQFRTAIQIAQRDPNIDSAIIIVTPQAVTDIPAIVEEIIGLSGKMPLYVALMGGDELEKFRHKLRQHEITCTPYANDLVDMLQALTLASDQKYLPSRYALSPLHTPTHPKQQLQTEKLHRKLSAQSGLSESFLKTPNLSEAFQLLKKAELSVPKYWIITDKNLDSIEKLSYPLFVKTANLSIVHKKTVGAVYGRVHTIQQAHEAFIAMRKFGEEVLFQELLDIEHEVLVGIEHDVQFGLYLTVGLGGSYTNILADRQYCFLPAPQSIIEKTWKQTKAYQLFKDTPELSDAMIDQLQSLQKLIMQNPWIKGLEINPLAISQGKIWVADIKLQV